MQSREINRHLRPAFCSVAARVGRIFDDHLTARCQFADRLAREIRFHLERAAKLTFEIFERRVNVAFIRHALEDVQHRGARALNRIPRDSEFLRDRIGRPKTDPVYRPRKHVRIAAHRLQRILAVEFVDSPRVRGRDVVAAQEHRQLAQSRRIAPCRSDSARHHRPDSRHFAHPLRRVVQHFAEPVAEVFRDSPRRRGPDALNFRREVALDRDCARWPDRFKIDHLELIAEARMLFVRPLRANRRANFHAREIADHHDPPVAAMLERRDDHRDRIAAVLINVEHRVEDSLDRLACVCRLRHQLRITRRTPVVQLPRPQFFNSPRHLTPHTSIVSQCLLLNRHDFTDARTM